MKIHFRKISILVLIVITIISCQKDDTIPEYNNFSDALATSGDKRIQRGDFASFADLPPSFGAGCRHVTSTQIAQTTFRLRLYPRVHEKRTREMAKGVGGVVRRQLRRSSDSSPLGGPGAPGQSNFLCTVQRGGGSGYAAMKLN